MIDEVRKNIDAEIEILREISNMSKRIPFAPADEQELLKTTIESLKASMKMINTSVPVLLESDSRSGTNVGIPFEQVRIARPEKEIQFIVPRQQRDELLKELSISEQLIGRLKKRTGAISSEQFSEFRKPIVYLQLANKYFRPTSGKLLEKGYYKSLSSDLKRGNFDVLTETYVSMLLFSTSIALMVGIVLGVLSLFISISITFPFFSLFSGSIVTRIPYFLLIPIAFSGLTYFFIVTYPSGERKTLARKIDQELPFAVIHMSAISGSGIEPTEIFKIIGLSKEYPHLRREIRKVLNQINLFGYDLVTALSNVSKATPSSKLSELFNGLGTTIHSGGSLQDYFEKRSETLLIEYRIEREKFNKIAETFMDIYISAVIAAPMILMLLLIMISISGISVGLTPHQMTFLIVAIIAVINFGFIGFLQMKQPSY